MLVKELLKKTIEAGQEFSYVEIIKGHEHHIISLKNFKKYPEHLCKEVKKFNFKTYEEYSDDFDVPPYVKCSFKVVVVEVEGK